MVIGSRVPKNTLEKKLKMSGRVGRFKAKKNQQKNRPYVRQEWRRHVKADHIRGCHGFGGKGKASYVVPNSVGIGKKERGNWGEKKIKI